MNLGIYYGIDFFYDGNAYFCDRVFGKYVAEIAKKVCKLVIFAPVTQKNSKYKSYRVNQRNVEIVALPHFTTYTGSLKHCISIYRVFNKNVHRADIFWIRFPTPFGYFLHYTAKHRKKKTFFQVAGDSKKIIRYGTKYSGFWRRIAICYASVEEYILRRMMNGTLTFVNGSGLYEKYKDTSGATIMKVITSTLTKEDFYYRNDTCLGQKVRILFVGFLRHEKGLDYLLKALKILSEEGINVELCIVGDGPYKSKLVNLAQSLNIADKVRFCGYLPLGAELQEFYARADVFVLPSISEGTPRVLLEAMARGVPIVAARVGGIPDIILHEQTGLLVSPGDEQDLASAIHRLIKDKKIGEKLIENGYSFARQHTLENFIDMVLDNTHVAWSESQLTQVKNR